jgi:hypothetical protein
MPVLSKVEGKIFYVRKRLIWKVQRLEGDPVKDLGRTNVSIRG